MKSATKIFFWWMTHSFFGGDQQKKSVLKKPAIQGVFFTFKVKKWFWDRKKKGKSSHTKKQWASKWTNLRCFPVIFSYFSPQHHLLLLLEPMRPISNTNQHTVSFEKFILIRFFQMEKKKFYHNKKRSRLNHTKFLFFLAKAYFEKWFYFQDESFKTFKWNSFVITHFSNSFWTTSQLVKPFTYFLF